MIERVIIVALVLAVTALVAWWWRSREGKLTTPHDAFFEPADVRLNGERPSVLLVEFVGEHCRPCRTVEQRLHKLAREVPGVQVVSIDAGERLDLADRYKVRRVPTVFIADSSLRVVGRASGLVSEDTLRDALPVPVR